MMELVKKLHLKRPLVFFDLETTGTKVGVDRIVEMAMVKLMPDGTVIKKPEAPWQGTPHLGQSGNAYPARKQLGAWRV